VKLAAAKMASDKRNYDKLMCKVVHDDDNDDKKPNEEEEEEEDGGGRAGATIAEKSSKSSESKSQQQEEQEASAQPSPPSLPLKLHSQTNHPGLTAYYNWHATITSLYRIYAIPSYDTSNTTNNNKTFIPAILPMQPSSERGKVAINITVYNQTQYESIQVYWIDYRGNEVYKGSIRKGGQWVQTTYIGHPWTFRVGNVDENDNGGEENVLLKYVPFRVVPSVLGAETTTGEGGVGTQQFTLRDVPHRDMLHVMKDIYHNVGSMIQSFLNHHSYVTYTTVVVLLVVKNET
jgi:hypothetical protein